MRNSARNLQRSAVSMLYNCGSETDVEIRGCCRLKVGMDLPTSWMTIFLSALCLRSAKTTCYRNSQCFYFIFQIFFFRQMIKPVEINKRCLCVSPANYRSATSFIRMFMTAFLSLSIGKFWLSFEWSSFSTFLLHPTGGHGTLLTLRRGEHTRKVRLYTSLRTLWWSLRHVDFPMMFYFTALVFPAAQITLKFMSLI